MTTENAGPPAATSEPGISTLSQGRFPAPLEVLGLSSTTLLVDDKKLEGRLGLSGVQTTGRTSETIEGSCPEEDIRSLLQADGNRLVEPLARRRAGEKRLGGRLKIWQRLAEGR